MKKSLKIIFIAAFIGICITNLQGSTSPYLQNNTTNSVSVAFHDTKNNTISSQNLPPSAGMATTQTILIPKGTANISIKSNNVNVITNQILQSNISYIVWNPNNQYAIMPTSQPLITNITNSPVSLIFYDQNNKLLNNSAITLSATNIAQQTSFIPSNSVKVQIQSNNTNNIISISPQTNNSYVINNSGNNWTITSPLEPNYNYTTQPNYNYTTQPIAFPTH